MASHRFIANKSASSSGSLQAHARNVGGIVYRDARMEKLFAADRKNKNSYPLPSLFGHPSIRVEGLWKLCQTHPIGIEITAGGRVGMEAKGEGEREREGERISCSVKVEVTPGKWAVLPSAFSLPCPPTVLSAAACMRVLPRAGSLRVGLWAVRCSLLDQHHITSVHIERERESRQAIQVRRRTHNR